MAIPQFRKLKAGDTISATEWNALVDMITGLYRSTMTDGIMDSTGFHPRKRLLKPTTIDPIIMLNGPKTQISIPMPIGNSSSEEMIPLTWKYALSNYKDVFELASDDTGIILKKRGLYRVSGKIMPTLYSPTPGTYEASPVIATALIQWYYNQTWYSYSSPLSEHTVLGRSSIFGKTRVTKIGGTGNDTYYVDLGPYGYLDGTARFFAEANTIIRCSAHLVTYRQNGTVNFAESVSALDITYCGDIAPKSDQDTESFKPYDYLKNGLY